MTRDSTYLLWVEQDGREFWELGSWNMDKHYFTFDKMSQSGGKRTVLKYFDLPNGVTDLLLHVYGSWNEIKSE